MQTRKPLVESPNGSVDLSNEEIARYSRHLIMPEVASTQKQLKQARVLTIGAGGLGARSRCTSRRPDRDHRHRGLRRRGRVEPAAPDHPRHLRPGASKLESARESIEDINPNVKRRDLGEPLSSENALEIFEDFDVIVDGTDNFPTRYLVNDASVLTGKPNVYGLIFRFEGQASVFYAEEGPCYRCLYPEPPPPGLVPSCAEGGVLGIPPGAIGTIQATETVKLILGIGEPLIGRLLLYDAWACASAR